MSPRLCARDANSYLQWRDDQGFSNMAQGTSAYPRYLMETSDLVPLATDGPATALNIGASRSDAAELEALRLDLPRLDYPTAVIYNSDVIWKQPADTLLQTIRVPVARAKGWKTRHHIMMHMLLEDSHDVLTVADQLLLPQGYDHDWLGFLVPQSRCCVSPTGPDKEWQWCFTRKEGDRDVTCAILGCPEDAVRWAASMYDSVEPDDGLSDVSDESLGKFGVMATDHHTVTLKTTVNASFYKHPISSQWSYGSLYHVKPSRLARLCKAFFAPHD